MLILRMSLEHSFCMLFICAYVGLTLKFLVVLL